MKPGKLIYGPYIDKRDNRKICEVKYKTGVKTTLYARYKLEKHLGRALTKYETVDHIDEDPTNDRLSNLQVLSLSENVKKSMRLNPERHARMLAYGKRPEERQRRKLRALGQKNPASILTDNQVIRLRKLKNLDRKAVCQQYGISDRALRDALSGVSYSHLPYANTRWKDPGGAGVGRPAKLTDQQVIQLRSMKNFDVHKAAKKYGLSKWATYSARSGKTYSHI